MDGWGRMFLLPSLFIHSESNWIMRTKVIILLLASMMILAGCATKPTSGVVGWKSGTFSVGSYAPDIPFTSVDGKKTTFHKVRQPIAIVAFTSPPAEECCWVRPDLLSLTKRFKVLPVTVAQVSVPTSKCPHGADCVKVCNLGKANLISLCDADRKAWNAHDQPYRFGGLKTV